MVDDCHSHSTAEALAILNYIEVPIPFSTLAFYKAVPGAMLFNLLEEIDVIEMREPEVTQWGCHTSNA